MKIKGALSLSSYSILFRRFCHGSPSSSSSPRPGLLEQYKRLVRQGKLQHDMHQERVATELDDLLERLRKYEIDMEDYHAKMSRWEESRENERRHLLLEEAKSKQNGGLWIKGKDRNENGILGNWMSRRRGSVEPGVGKMVSYLNREKKLDSLVGQRPHLPVAPKGIYLYGNVGCGKTMLMDMFYNATGGIVQHRRRYHFHEAMLEIHEQMHGIWKKERESKDETSSGNVVGGFRWIASLPFDAKVKEWLIGEEKYNQEVQRKHILSAVADKFLIDRVSHTCGASLLCFDEIQTVDVFAVVALSGILSRLLSTGTVLVATSNRAPEELNQDGMQREIFLDFLSKLEYNCKTVHVSSDTDYRRLIPIDKVDQVHYFWPLNSANSAKFELAWQEVCSESGANIISTVLPVMFGRSLEVAESCNGSAKFDFEYLCGRPVGAADYIAIARNYHTVFISQVPVMSMKIRDKARRFITLIDELYNHHCRVFCLSSSSIDELFQGTEEGTLFDMESFQFETDIEGGKLRRDVTAVGTMGTRPTTTGLEFIMSGQEELFAFRRAISRLIEMQSPLYLQGVKSMHTLFCQKNSQLAARTSNLSQSSPSI
ncbi:Lactation elevated protein 1 [Rhynchospora pubera]|uniref:Lactation elevated protein 1 n=1 Tax=Rhynchospora pubera TaxID=906938 RepID=A0AAV8DVF5_9POAL|nr:Lactation elevated protein 1 [Rhynchospora pubera]